MLESELYLFTCFSRRIISMVCSILKEHKSKTEVDRTDGKISTMLLKEHIHSATEDRRTDKTLLKKDKQSPTKDRQKKK